jgi:hypothetical protein
MSHHVADADAIVKTQFNVMMQKFRQHTFVEIIQ